MNLNSSLITAKIVSEGKEIAFLAFLFIYHLADIKLVLEMYQWIIMCFWFSKVKTKITGIKWTSSAFQFFKFLSSQS